MASSKQLFDFQIAIEECELCQEEEANFFCQNCQQHICRGCKITHLWSNLSSNHNVISTSLSKTDKTPRKPVKCHTHPREIIRMFCKICDEFVCVKCIADIKHENHRFEELETTLHRYKEHILKYMSEAKEETSKLEISLQKIDANVKDYNEASDKTIDGINEQRIQIKLNVDTIADSMVDQVQKRRKQDLQLMEKERKDIQKVITNHKKYLTFCQEKMKSVNSITDIKLQIKKLDESITTSVTRINPPTFVSYDSMNLQDMFGKLVDLLDESKSKQTMPASENFQKNPTNDDNTDNLSINTISKEVVSSFNSPVICRYVSFVNEMMAWCGYLQNLILVSIHGNVKRRITLDASLCGLTVTLLGEPLVTFGAKIQKYLLNGKCVDIANTEPYHSKGITLTSQGDILVCLCRSEFDNKVLRMTTAGQVKQTIQNKKKHRPLFKDPQYVAENINRDVVVLDDNDPATIVVTTKEGRLRYKYPDLVHLSHTIDRCHGIACDNNGCILASDYGNKRIHQIDIDGRFIQFILSEQEGIQLPWGLSIDNKDQLWLSNENGLEVTVYKYSSVHE